MQKKDDGQMSLDERQVSLTRRKVKYARITITPSMEVKIVVPLRYREVDIRLLLSEKAKWIEKQLAFFRQAKQDTLKLASGEILYLGEAITPNFQLTTAAALEAWYRAEAKRVMMKRLEELATEHGFSYNRVFFRGSKTKWGTCSSKKNLSFNWRLIKAPPFIIDYLILHELTHTIVFNHSKMFWYRLSLTCPEYAKAKDWLKKYGKSLY